MSNDPIIIKIIKKGCNPKQKEIFLSILFFIIIFTVGKDAIQSKKTAGTVTTIDGLLTFHSYYIKVGF